MTISIVGNTQDASTLKAQKMTPTIVIALGGSGKKSVINLRKLFLEKYGECSLPIVDFLYLDTDINEITIANENLYQLDANDTIDASINGVDFESMMSNLEGLHPHIHKWFEGQKIAPACSGGVADGAKKIRALGKLSFYLKYDEFVNKLERKIARITNEETKKRTRDMLIKKGNISPEFNDNFEVILIGSLAGGTGSGCFIDAAFAAKNIAKKRFSKIPQMTAMLCLPSAFDGLVSDERDKAYANGYAALKELDYYLSYYDQVKDETTNDFLIDFEWKRGQKEQVSAPPFNTVYLLEDENLDRKNVGGKEALDDIYKMIAEFMFLDFNESSFSSKKRSLHSNVNVNLGSKTQVLFEDSGYVEFYPNRYSSFGLSQVKLGVDKLRKTATFKVAKDMVALLNYKPEKQVTFDNSTWHQFGLDESVLLSSISGVEKRQLEERWSEGYSDIQGGKHEGFAAIYKAVRGKEFSNHSKKECVAYLNEQATKINKAIIEFDEFIRFEIIEENPRLNAKMRESIYARIKKSGDEIIEQCDARILKALTEYQYEGVSFAKEFTDKLLQQVERQYKVFNGFLASTITGLEKVKLIKAGDNPELEELKRHVLESKDLFPLPLFKKHALSVTNSRLKRAEDSFKSDTQNSFEKKLAEINDAVNKMIGSSLNRLIAQRIIKMLDRLKDHFEEKRRYIENYENALDSIYVEYQKDYEIYSANSFNARNIELTMNSTESDFEKQLGSSSEYDDYIKGHLDEFLNGDFDNSLGEDKFSSLLIACNGYQHNPQKFRKFLSCLDKFIDIKTEDFTFDGVESAIELFNSTFEDAEERNAKIRSLVGYCAPRIRLSETNSGNIDIKLLGCDPEQTLFVEEIRKLGSQLDAQEFSKDEVVFYNEIVGFPAFKIETIGNMKAAYDDLLRKNPDENYLRHTDKRFDKFPELVRPSQNEAKERVDKLKPFCMAFITGLIHFNGEQFVLNKENEFGQKIGEPLRNSLLASAYGLTEQQKTSIQRARGPRYLNEIDNLDNADERFLQLLLVLADLTNTTATNKTMLTIALEQLRDEIYIKMLSNLNVIGKGGETLFNEIKADIDKAKEEYPELLELFSRRDGMLKNIKLFTKETGYFEKELGAFIDQDGISTKGKYIKVLNW